MGNKRHICILAATYMVLLITRGQDFLSYVRELLLNTFYFACHIIGYIQ